jgi:competence protein ComEC
MSRLSFLAALCLVGMVRLHAQRPIQDSAVVITMLDVGQGDATLITTPDNKRILIDAGPSAVAMRRRLWEGSDTLDLVIASHNHDDHIGGMAWVFDRFVVRAYVENGVPHTSATYRGVMRAVEAEKTLYLEATARTITVGGVTLRILPPARRDASQNDNSVGVLIEFGKFRALLTGDSEERQLRQWLSDQRIPRVHVLKAAHHGARNGFVPALAQVARPRAVVVSVAERNGYGHPSASVLRAWERAGAKVYRTDRDSTIIVRGKLDGTFEVLPTANRVLSAPIRD